MCPSSIDDQPKDPNFLQKQLDRARFERALEVARSMVEKGVYLNTAELARINNILLGQKHQDGRAHSPWRDGATVCVLPSGNHYAFQVLADPINKAKEILTRAKEKAANGDVIDAAADLYAQLVLNHVFQDANRRTAVVASAYLLKLCKIEISAMGLHELGLGDLRDSDQMEALRDMMRNAVKIGSKKPRT